MSPIKIRQLSAQERARAFARATGGFDIAPYVETVREMEGDIAYALAVNGTTPRVLKVRMNKAAKVLGLKLRWARAAKDAAELVTELEDAD